MNISGSPARCGTETGVHEEVARRIETAGRVLITSALVLAMRPSKARKSFMVPTATTTGELRIFRCFCSDAKTTRELRAEIREPG